MESEGRAISLSGSLMALLAVVLLALSMGTVSVEQVPVTDPDAPESSSHF